MLNVSIFYYSAHINATKAPFSIEIHQTLPHNNKSTFMVIHIVHCRTKKFCIKMVHATKQQFHTFKIYLAMVNCSIYSYCSL